jgi:hypothetical protein
MALLDINWKPSHRELKVFALMWIGFFALIGAWALWRHESQQAAVIFWVVAAAGLVGLVRPSVFRPVYVVWMALVLPIGWTVSHLLLMFVYYLVLTPIGLGMKAVGYDPMERKLDPAAKSYWIAHDPEADSARYFKQF